MNQDLIKISVVISAKDEESNIASLIKSLQCLKYSADCFEVIIVDDYSSDNSFLISGHLSSKSRNIKTYKSSAAPGKKNALTFGICMAKYPFILLTDADCCPAENWMKAFAEKFKNGYDVVFGAAPFIQTKSFISQISCFENLRSSMLSFTAASAGKPYSAFGRSIGFSRNAYKIINGYKHTMDIPSGDDGLLIREAVKNNLKIGYVTGKDAFVYSAAKHNLKEYLVQKARHTRTSFYYSYKIKFLLGAWHLINLAFLFSPFLMFINWKFGLLFIVKTIFDLTINIRSQKKFGYKFSAVQLFYLQFIYEMLLIIHFFNALFKRLEWKKIKI